jgi:hypothetical protein
MNFLRGLRNPPGITAKTAKEISGDCSAPAGPELQDQVKELIGRFVRWPGACRREDIG